MVLNPFAHSMGEEKWHSLRDEIAELIVVAADSAAPCGNTFHPMGGISL